MEACQVYYFLSGFFHTLWDSPSQELHFLGSGVVRLFWAYRMWGKVDMYCIGKDPDAGRDWGQEEKGTREDEMAGWHHQIDGHEFEWTPGVGDGQGGLACCDSWGRKESNTTEQLNWIDELVYTFKYLFCFIKIHNLHVSKVKSIKHGTLKALVYILSLCSYMTSIYLQRKGNREEYIDIWFVHRDES